MMMQVGIVLEEINPKDFEALCCSFEVSEWEFTHIYYSFVNTS